MEDSLFNQTLEVQAERLHDGLSTLVHTLVSGLDDHLAPHNFNAVTYTVLQTCFMSGTISIKDLRALVPLDYGALSQVVSGLEDNELVEKFRTREDRRVVNVRVTEKGASIIAELTVRVNEYYARVTRNIGADELAENIAVMQKMVGGGGQLFGMNDPAKEQALGMQIAALQGSVTNLVNLLFRGIEERMRPYDLNVAEYAVLFNCFIHEPVTISGIGEYVPIDPGRISRMVSRFEDMGLVRKIRLRKDRRVVRVRMTDKGRDLAPEVRRLASEHYANVMSSVSPEEVARLIDFVEKMTANAEAARAQTLR